MAFPSQAGYRRRQRWEGIRGLLILGAAVGGLYLGVVLALGDGSVVWLGVAIVVLSVLIPVALVVKAIVGLKKQAALRERGTVQLLTVASSYIGALDHPDYWELTSEMQIRLDSGATFRGSYCATVQDRRLRRTLRAPDGELIRRHSGELIPHFDEWFRVGASLECRYNPTNPDQVVVFPFAAPGDRVWYKEYPLVGPDYVWFASAT